MPQRKLANAEREVQMIVQLGDWTPEILWDFVSPPFGNKKNHVHIGSRFGARHPHSLATRCCGSGGVNTLQIRQLVQGPSREIRFIVFGINRHVNHQTSKCNPKEVRSPSIPPRGMAWSVHLENCQDPLLHDHLLLGLTWWAQNSWTQIVE